MMDMQQRGEFLAKVYKVQGDLHALYSVCQQTNSLSDGVAISISLQQINDLIESHKPEQFHNPRTMAYIRKNVYGLRHL